MINCVGYINLLMRRDKPGHGAWSAEQEDELRRLFAENQANPETNQGELCNILPIVVVFHVK